MSVEMITAFSFSESKLSIRKTSYMIDGKSLSNSCEKLQTCKVFMCEEEFFVELGSLVVQFIGGTIDCKNSNQYKLHYAFTKSIQDFLSFFSVECSLQNLDKLSKYLNSCPRVCLIKLAKIFISYFTKSYDKEKYAVLGKKTCLDHNGKKVEYQIYLSDTKRKRYSSLAKYYDFLKAQYLLNKYEMQNIPGYEDYKFELIKESK